jgi:hypothetical protein
MWWIIRLACLVLLVVTARWWWPRLRRLPREGRPSELGLSVVALAVVLAVGAQLLPYGWFHSNPAVVQEPVWDSQQTRDLAVRACFDCHSNQVRYPWYTNIAPVSWLVQNDVSGGRGSLNFSEWTTGGRGESAREVSRVIDGGSMPPNFYVWLHPSAKLTAAEKAALVAGLSASLAAR